MSATPDPAPAGTPRSGARSIIAWVLVSVGALFGALTVWFAGAFATTYGPTSGLWIDGALWALQFGAPGIVITVILAAVAIFVGRGVAVRAVAGVVIVGVLLCTAMAGGSGVTDRYAAASKEPACEDLGVAVDPRIPAAFDELTHPGWVDTITASVSSCGVAVRNYSAAEAIDFYQDQLVGVGWVIETGDDIRLVAHRDDLTFTISACGEESWLEITAGATAPQGC